MRRNGHVSQFRHQAAALALTAFTIVAATQAQAASSRFLSANGNDANNCSRTAPCRTLQRGLDATPNSGGALQILDSGDYGGATIRKSITISADGVAANVGALIIDRANATVVLRGLLVSGPNAPASGIAILAAGTVHIVRCEVERFPQVGIFLAAVTTDLFVTDSIARLNGGAGLQVKGGGTSARLTVDNSRFERNGLQGLSIDRIHSTLTRVVSSANGSDGIEQSGGQMNATWTTAADNAASGYRVGGGGSMVLESSIGRGNTTNGLFNDDATAIMSNSAFTHNAVGVNTVNGGFTQSRQNNTVANNFTINQFGPISALGPL